MFPKHFYSLRLKKSIAIEVNKVDYETLAEQKHKLKDNNINTLIVTLNDAYEFDENKPEVKFVREMKKDGYNVIIALNPVVTDYYLVWSQSSEKSEYKGKFDKYASYYIWKSGSNGENPNKWVRDSVLLLIFVITGFVNM